MKDLENKLKVLVADMKPCPFCGGPGFIETHYEFVFWGLWFRARCDRCMCLLTADEDPERAVRLWNMRVEGKE